MRPKAKYHVIYAHRDQYPVQMMCQFFGVSRSGYYSFVKRLGKPEADADLAKAIQRCQDSCDKTYGYRRVWRWLESQGFHRNKKTVLRVMKKYGLLSEIRRRRKCVQMGQQVHKYENLLNRHFHADRPNSKWVTDISYIHTGQGVLFLSMIRDLYDNNIIRVKSKALPLLQTHPIARTFKTLKPRCLAGFSAFWEPTVPLFWGTNSQRAALPKLPLKLCSGCRVRRGHCVLTLLVCCTAPRVRPAISEGHGWRPRPPAGPVGPTWPPPGEDPAAWGPSPPRRVALFVAIVGHVTPCTAFMSNRVKLVHCTTFLLIRVKLVQRAIFVKIDSKQHSDKLVHFGPVKRLWRRKTDADNERHPRLTGMSFIWLHATQSPVRRDNVPSHVGLEIEPPTYFSFTRLHQFSVKLIKFTHLHQFLKKPCKGRLLSHFGRYGPRLEAGEI